MIRNSSYLHLSAMRVPRRDLGHVSAAIVALKLGTFQRIELFKPGLQKLLLKVLRRVQDLWVSGPY